MFRLSRCVWPRPSLDPDACRLIALCMSCCDGNGPSAPISLGGFFSISHCVSKTLLPKPVKGFFFVLFGFLSLEDNYIVLRASKIYAQVGIRCSPSRPSPSLLFSLHISFAYLIRPTEDGWHQREPRDALCFHYTHHLTVISRGWLQSRETASGRLPVFGCQARLSPLGGLCG